MSNATKLYWAVGQKTLDFYKKCGMRGDEVQMRVDRTSFESEIPHEGII